MTRPARLPRRRFLRRLALAGIGAAAGACGGGGPDPVAIAERKRRYDPSLDCSSAAGLWPAEIATRTDNDYRERSDQELRFCFNCTNFIEPQPPGSCARCRTVKGTVHPLGWCKAWTELQD